MKDFLIELVNASFQGGVIIAVILVLRFLLRKTPKSTLCLLWLLAIIRLLLPIQLESNLSLQPDITVITQSQTVQTQIPSQTPVQQVPAAPMEPIQIGDGEIIEPIYSDAMIAPEQPAVFHWSSVLPWTWLSVAVGLALWSILSYLRLRKHTKSAIVLGDGVWLSLELDSAFVLGYLKPRIYLPAKLDEQEQNLVIAHEQAHIRRFDHWYKLLGFIALCVHWFNPLVWLAYIFLCRDMEMACDEQVVRDMDTAQRKAYSMALLRCSADSHHFKPCPVAFAEVSVKDRIKGVLNYKKPGFWAGLVGIVAIVFVAVCFLTSPVMEDDATKMTRLCREAVEEIQNANSYYLTEEQYVTRVYGEDFVGLAYDTAESLRCGSDWLRVTVSPDFTNCYLQKDGQQYIKYISDAVAPGELGYADWTAVDLSQIQTFRLSWLEELDWDQHEIVYVDQVINPAGLLDVSFTMDLDESDPDLTMTTLSFQFDPDTMTLLSVSKCITSQSGGKDSKVTIEAVNDPTIDQTIDAYYHGVSQLSPDDLRQKCIDIQKMLYGTVASLDTDSPIHLLITWDIGGEHEYQREMIHALPLEYFRTTFTNSDYTQEYFYVMGDEYNPYEYYKRTYNTSMRQETDTGWITVETAPALSCFIQWVTPDELENNSFSTYTDDNGLSCIFEIADEKNTVYTYTYHFGPGGSLVSITQDCKYLDGETLTNTAVIVSTSADEIKAELETIYSKVREDNQ